MVQFCDYLKSRTSNCACCFYG